MGATAVVGWCFQRPLLIQVLPQFSPMAFNTALGFILGGLALLAKTQGQSLVTRILGAAIALVALLTLGQSVLGVNLRVDQLFINPYFVPGLTHLGRMSPVTAACLAFVGMAFVLMTKPCLTNRCNLVLACMGMAVGGVGGAALFGYVSGITEMYSWGDLPDVAANTAAGLLFLGSGVFLEAWHGALADRHHSPRWLPVPLGCALTIFTVILWRSVMTDGGVIHATLGFILLGFGLAVSGLLAGTIYLAQKARDEQWLALQELAERRRAEQRLLQSEEALRTSEKRYRQLFESMEEGFAVCEMIYDAAGQPADYRHLAVNPAFLRLTGLVEDRVVGRTVKETIPDLESFWIETYGQVVKSGQSRRFENRAAGLGKEFEVYVWRSAPGQFAVVFSDITERKRIEEEVRRQREWLRVTLNSIGDAVIASGTNGRVTFLNPIAASLTGWQPEEAEGQPVTEVFKIINEHTRQTAEDLVARVLREGRILGLANHTALVARNGREIPIEDSAAPICDASGQVTGVVLVFRDVTEHKRLEGQLRQAQKMESIGLLAGGIAHDFNNVLTVIQGHAELLLGSGKRSPEEIDSILQITDATERCANLTRQLLAFSRRQILQQEVLDLNRVINDVGRMLGTIVGEHIALRINYAPVPSLVRADRGMMEQILINFAVNSRDAMPAGGALSLSLSEVRLNEETVREHPEARPGHFIRLTVRDSGCGIEPKDLPLIFEPFFTTKDVGKGTGLGLATVYGIVKQHEGWIEVASVVGKGATFQIFLPACTGKERQE